jgi:hypothetical protein
VFVQSTWLRSREAVGWPMRFGFVQDLIEEVTLCKFNGRPHWGKNFDRTFTHPKCPVKPRYPQFEQLLKVAKPYDKDGAFMPELFKKVCCLCVVGCWGACVCARCARRRSTPPSRHTTKKLNNNNNTNNDNKKRSRRAKLTRATLAARSR